MKVWSWRDAIRQSDLQPTTKLVLYTVSIYMNEIGGGAFPSYKTLANDCGLSKRTTMRHIEIAIQAGFIGKEKGLRENGSYTSNRYKATYPSWVVSRVTLGSDTGDTRGSVTGDTPINTPVINTPSNKKTNKKVFLREKPVTDAFDLWNSFAQENGLSEAQVLSDQRNKKIKARLKDCGGIDGWQRALDKISDSDFLLGKKTDFKATLDFVLQKSSFIKIMEGAYDGKSKQQYSAIDDWVERG